MFKRKSQSSILFVVFSLMLGLSACGDDQTSNNGIPNQMFTKQGTIQGTIFDATTGERIAGTDLKITLIQGVSHRSPSKLITSATDPLAGEYAFADVPVELDAGNITYKMVVTKDNYQRFEGNVTLASAAGTLAGTTDTFYNFIGNIYLFKLGETAPELKVVVEYDQEPVIGAQVRLQQNAVANAAGAELGNRLLPSLGLLPTLTVTTVADSNGNAVATFAGSSLVLGGSYTATVLPLQREGILLTTAASVGGILVGGPTVLPIVIAMADLEPGIQDDGIHVVFASNRDADDITGLTNPGVLTLVFNRAVAKVGDIAAASGGTPFTATVAGGGTLTGPTLDTSVDAVLSTDGLTLTLTPVFTTAPATTDENVSVTYAGGLVTVAGDEGAVGNAVFGLRFLDGTVISTTVNVTGP